jgi:hypothetical protein
MTSAWSRRSLLKLGAICFPVSVMNRPSAAFALNGDTASSPDDEIYPRLPLELVREVVTVSHFSLDRVRELVETRPALSRAAWDWGFGDTETALGAASHMGNRPIAEYLIAKGARPSLFSAAMLGQLEVIKAFVQAQPGVQRIAGPHSISLLAHAKAGGEKAHGVYDFLGSLGDADAPPEAPLSEEKRQQILGTYVFGAGSTQIIAITMEHNPFTKTDQLTWTRKGTMGRALYHQADGTFFPAGAPAVHIAFTMNEKSITMMVTDADRVVIAQRTS